MLGGGSSSGGHLAEHRLKALVWHFKEVDRLFILLPYPEIIVDIKAVPDNGVNEEPDWPLGWQTIVVLRSADGIASSVHRQRKVFRRLVVSGLGVVVPTRRISTVATVTNKVVPAGMTGLFFNMVLDVVLKYVFGTLHRSRVFAS